MEGRLIWIIVSALTIACAQPPDAPADVQYKRVEFSILEDYDKGDDLSEVAADFDLFAELGISTWRGSIGWDDYEPARGTYDFEWLHRFAELASTRGITLRPYIGYTPAWAAAGGRDSEAWNDPPRDVQDWHAFVYALSSAMQRHRNLVSYEIYNEQNVPQWWDGSPFTYKEIVHVAADAIERGHPGAAVLLGGMVYPDGDWLESVCGDGQGAQRVDVIPFHAYPETWTPANVTVENYLGTEFQSGFVDAADTACGRKPIWINEAGFATTAGRTEEAQAQWWIRAAATWLAEPRIEHLGIYEIKDLPPGEAAIGDAANYHLGIARANRQRKIAFGTITRLVSMFAQPVAVADSRLSVSVSPPEAEVYRHAFIRQDGAQLLFVWTRQQSAVVSVTLPACGSRATEYGIDGTPAGRLDVTDCRLGSVALNAGQVRYFEIAQ